MSKSKLIVSIILLLSLIITFIPGCMTLKPSGSVDGYTAIIPSTLEVGIPQAISVALFHQNQPASGQVQMVISKDGKDVFSTSHSVYGNSNIQFTIPPVPQGDYDISIKGDSFSDKTTVKIENKYLVFVETDKPIYKPGQDILMRVFSLNSDLMPVSEDVTIDVLDAKGIKVFQSVVTTDDYGMANLDLPLSNEPNLGVWKINSTTPEGNSELDVQVQEYVLPKYEVNVVLPHDWYLVNEPVEGKVTAEYSFGKPVQGEVEIKAWRYVGEWQQYNTFTASINGESEFTLPAVGYLAGVPAAGGNGNVRLDVTVTENSTGYVQETSQLLTVSESSVNVQIIPSGIVFKPGLPYSFLVVTQTPDNKMVESNAAVNVTYYNKDFNNAGSEQQNVTTTGGQAMVNITPPESAVALTINCTAQGTQATKTIEAGYSPSGNFIHIEQVSTGTPNIGDEIRFHVYSTQEARTFYYEIISRNRVVFSDYSNNPEIAFQVTPVMGPSAKLLVYQILADSEVAADYIPFDVTADYPQDVQVGFSTQQTAPGSNVDINIQTGGEAEVGIAAVDKSVFILTENRMNLQEVFDKLEQLYMNPQVELGEVNIYNGINTQGASEIFQDAGVTVLSNKQVPDGQKYKNDVFGGKRGGIFFNGVAQAPGALEAMTTTATTTMTMPATTTTTLNSAAGTSTDMAEVQRIRQYFPETWLWQQVTTDSNGQASINVTVPDSITTWMLRAVAISKTQGLGVAEAQLVAFQPFFLTADLPYSAIRGEEFPVKVAVYNYLDQAQTVQVDMQTQDWFDLLDTPQKTVTIQPNDIGSVEFNIRPKALGNNDLQISARSSQAADAIVKPLLVEAEGVSQETVDNLVLAPGSQTIDTSITQGAVDGSGRAYFAATAGYLTQTMDGLDQLIQMPFGCGEQNMINFAPDVFITKYLKASGQLKPEIMAKAETMMLTGYQRELTYRHSDGSFSAFGDNDASGSLWLTAFVLESFAQAKDIIYVDDSILQSAASWITSHQNSDGSFDAVGLIIHQDLMGGLQGKTALTAYVAAALLQAGEKTASARAVTYLESQLSQINDAYTMALTAYALELAQSPKGADACTKLMGMAKEDANGLHWGDNPVITPENSTNQKFGGIMAPVRPDGGNTSGIEATAYAEMALTLQKDTLDAGKAAKYLVSQRNAYGGFGSTQDTVVALEALTLYSTGYRSDVNLTVSLTVNGTVIKALKIDSTNFDVLQTVSLPVNQAVTVDISGTGEAIGQVVRRFNMPAAENTAQDMLNISVKYDASNVEVNDIVGVSVSLSFNPPEPMEAGMTVVDISIPTGFATVTSSIDKVLQDNPIIKRYDIAGRKVIFYIDNLKSGDTVNFSFDVQAQYPVKAKGTVSQAYSYYQPDISSTVLGQDMTVN